MYLLLTVQSHHTGSHTRSKNVLHSNKIIPLSSAFETHADQPLANLHWLEEIILLTHEEKVFLGLSWERNKTLD